MLAELRRLGKVAEVGLSEVGVEVLEAARAVVPVVSVQNLYNLGDRHWEPVLEHCTTNDIGFIPWFPLSSGALAGPAGALRRVAEDVGASPAEVALAWLLQRSPVMVPIPGTSSVAHLEQNCAAAALHLDDGQRALLDESNG